LKNNEAFERLLSFFDGVHCASFHGNNYPVHSKSETSLLVTRHNGETVITWFAETPRIGAEATAPTTTHGLAKTGHTKYVKQEEPYSKTEYADDPDIEVECSNGLSDT